MRPKKLKWIKVKPEVFESFCYKAYIEVLVLNNEPAYYQVSESADNIRATFWCHNRAITICSDSDIYTAKNECQNHFDKLISENSQQ